MASFSHASSTLRLRAATLAILMLLGVVLAAVPTASAVALVDNTPFLDSLSGGNGRDDHSFTGTTGTWSAVGTLLYEQAGNQGDMRAELRRGSTLGAVVAQDSVGNMATRNPLSVVAVDGWNLNLTDTFYVSEILVNGAPSYAVEFEGSATTIFGSPYTDTTSMGANGVIQSYQVFLAKRDTIDVRLAVPSSYTYNYNLQLFLFGAGLSIYYSASGGSASGPAAVSGGPVNSAQYLRFTAPSDGWYLLVVGNTKELADVPYTVEVITNGRALGDRVPASGAVDTYNRNDDYRFGNAGSDWAFAALRNDNPGYGYAVTAELHSPTFDSNVLAYESPTTGSFRIGLIGVNTYDPDTVNLSLVTVKWGAGAFNPTPYTLELDNRVPSLAENESGVWMNFSAGEIVRGAMVGLAAGETVELHAQVDPLFTYPYELQLIAFAPGNSYYAAGAMAQAGPVAAARDGVNLPKDLTFTASASGFYGVAILNLLSTNAVPVKLTVIIQGRTLSPNIARTGDLSDANPQDQFTFTVAPNRWGVIAGRATGGSGTFSQRVHASGLDTNPVAWDNVGNTPGVQNYGIEAVNGYTLSSSTNFYASLVRTAGAPQYTVEYDSAPVTIPALNVTYSSLIPAGQIVEAYEIFLNARDTADFRVRAPSGYTYPYTLRVLAYAPTDRYYSLSGTNAPGPLSASPATPDAEQDIVITAPAGGYYLIAVANLGDLAAMPFELTVVVNGEPLSPGIIGHGDLTAQNSVNYYSFPAPSVQWTVAGVKIVSGAPGDTLVHSLRGPTPDSIALATDRVRGTGGEGILVVDGSTLSINTNYYLSESAALGGSASIEYEVQVTTGFQPLASQSQVVSGTLPSVSQFIGYTVQLNAGQTLDLRLRRAEGYSYPFNLGLYVFAPGSGNASSSGEAGGAPISASANGPSAEQDGIFTAPRSGSYLVLVANLDVPREVNFSLNLSLDGWELAENTHLAGDLNAYNRADQYSFTTAAGVWNVAGLKWTGGAASVRGGLHTLGLNTVALATVDVSSGDSVAVLPFFTGGNATSTFFLNVTLPPNMLTLNGEYAADFSGVASPWTRASLGTTLAYNLSGTGFLSLHTLDLKQGDALDISVFPDPLYNKPFDLRIAVYGTPLAPAVLAATPLARSMIGASLSADLAFTASEDGLYLLVVENAGALDTIPYWLSISQKSRAGSPPNPVQVTVIASGIDGTGHAYIDVVWTPNNESDFLFYRVYVATDPSPEVPVFPGEPVGDPIYSRDVTLLRIQGPNIKVGNTYYVRVEVVDTERLASFSPTRGQTIHPPAWYDDVLLVTLIGVAVGVVALIGLSYFLAKRREDGGKPFRVRSSKAEGVVEEGKGPKERPRTPKDEAPARPTTAPGGVPAPPSKQSQEAVDYMQRVLRGGR